MSGNRHTLLFLNQQASGENMLTLGRKVRNLNALGEANAVVCIDLPLSEIVQTLMQGCTVDGSISLITGRDGSVAASSEVTLPDIDFRKIVSENSPQKSFVTYDEKYFVQCKGIENTDLYYILVLSRTEMLLANAKAWLGVLALILIAALPTVLLAKHILNGMTGRIKLLGTHMQSVRLGRLEPTGCDINRDEIGIMTDDYNYMITRMQELLQEQYSVGKEARSAELRALQSQINPHFLYNTLDMVSWMARGNNTKEIQTVVKALAKFYRMSLSKGHDIITLSDELQIISNYMIIQHLRFGDNVTLEINIPDEILVCKLPKITLQPIIENALLHGILPKEDKRGLIKINGKKCNNDVLIEITDDGVGFDNNAGGENDNKYGKSGYGLYSIDRRLCLTFGIEKCLTISSEINKGTVVTLKFPIL